MFKDTAIVALGTAASRITGLMRVIVLGIILGQTSLADAFDGANNSPNSIYELLVGGVLAASLLPLFTRYAQDSDDHATSAVISVSVIVLMVATVVAVLCAPFIFHLYSLQPSALVDADEYRRAGTALARIFLIQIFFYGLTALGTALLNARRRFAMAAWAPVLANVVTIGLLLAIPLLRDDPPMLSDIFTDTTFFVLLTLSATGGIAVMALSLYPAIRRTDFSFRFTPDFTHPAVRSLLKTSFWTVGYVVTNQIALIVVKNLADPGSGNQDAYSKAFIFFMLPHSLLTLSIATTFVPELVRRVRDEDSVGFSHWMTSGIRWIVLLTIPSALFLAVLAHPIVSTLLEYGNFSSEAALNTSRALTGFAVGITGFSLYIFALRGFYAHQDTKTPFYVNLVQNAVNIVLALVLVDRHGVLGLGLAFGLSYIFAAALVVFLLHQRFAAIQWTSITAISLPVFTAAVAMAIALSVIHTQWNPTSVVTHVLELTAAVTIGGIIYAGVLRIFKVSELELRKKN